MIKNKKIIDPSFFLFIFLHEFSFNFKNTKVIDTNAYIYPRLIELNSIFHLIFLIYERLLDNLEICKCKGLKILRINHINSINKPMTLKYLEPYSLLD